MLLTYYEWGNWRTFFKAFSSLTGKKYNNVKKLKNRKSEEKWSFRIFWGFWSSNLGSRTLYRRCSFQSEINDFLWGNLFFSKEPGKVDFGVLYWILDNTSSFWELNVECSRFKFIISQVQSNSDKTWCNSRSRLM